LSSRATRNFVDYATKLLVILSIATAIFLEAYVAARAWPNQLPLTIAAFCVGAGLSVVFTELVVAIVLVFIYLMPGLLLVAHGDYSVFYGTLWLAALLGAIVPRSVRRAWAFPGRWKSFLVLWALTIATTWPVVVMREFDFKPSLLLDLSRLSRWDIEVLRPFAILWICDVASTLGVGLLWFDWLYGMFGGNESRFRRSILSPLAASWLVTSAVGIYQLFGDMLFLNFGLFGSFERASGTMRDANPFGIIAALGGPTLAAAGALTNNRLFRALAVCGMVISWLGLWASGARSALGVGLVAMAFLLYGAWTAFAKYRFSRRAEVGFVLAGVVAATAVAVSLFLLPDDRGPISRLRLTLPEVTTSSIGRFLQTLSDRDGYGVVAADMIRQFPLFGIGVGSFHLLVRDHYFLMTGVRTLFPDNAQNWYRHQFAEFGLVGSIGWMLWVMSFGWYVLSARSPQPAKFSASAVKGMLVAMALVSLVGMSTLNASVAITFWTLVFWFVALMGEDATDRALEPVEAGRNLHEAVLKPRLSSMTWLAIWLVVSVSIGGTAYAARHRLRVPQRAVDVGFPYQYGFSEPERVDLTRPSTVWTGRHAVAVLSPETRWVKLAVSVDSLNIAKGPVDVNIWCGGRPVLATRVNNAQPITRYFRVPDGAMRVLLETRVSRSVRPADFGIKDNRELGLLIDWDFVEVPPDGSETIQ
jgi:hypothetical protein